MSKRILAVLAVLASVGAALAADRDEFKVKREAVFEFAQKPRIAREGDRITIAFETRGLCDVTVAIENDRGKIIRHLASGVLGPKAPAPLQKNSKKQTLLWDGKDDQDVYMDDKDSCTVRVSLGLKPQFERTLFWSPHKRVGGVSPMLAASPDGVYVAETYMLDHGLHGGTQVRLFDHHGNYVRTVYPFPADKLDKVVGLKQQNFQYIGQSLPMKVGYYLSTLLRTGAENKGPAEDGQAIAAAPGKAALVYKRMFRLAPDGSSGGLPLEGPGVGGKIKGGMLNGKTMDFEVSPYSAALSPDGQTLYLTGYLWYAGWGHGFKCLHGVMKMEFGKDAEPQVFAGVMTGEGFGSDDGKFKAPTSVACDAKGRVYVSDYLNDRIQVFTPDGKLFKSIPAKRPTQLQVHQKTGEIYVFSWFVVTPYAGEGPAPEFTRLGPVEDPKVITRCPLPLMDYNATANWNNAGGYQYRTALDSWADEPTIWLVPAAAYSRDTCIDVTVFGKDWPGIRLLVEKSGKLVEKRDFGKDVDKAVPRRGPEGYWRQRLYVNPANGRLYLGEADSGVGNSFNQLVEIDPTTGKQRLVDLPLGAEDMCFDVNGLVYLRTDTMVARYDPTSWREVPWDYGEERKQHGYGMGARAADLVAGLYTPGHRSPAFWHLGGIDISVKGHLVVTTANVNEAPSRSSMMYQKGSAKDLGGKSYMPQIYPGRLRWGELHIWDKHGKLVCEDAVPGLGHLNGTAIDRDDNLYVLRAAKRTIDGKLYDPTLAEDRTGTLLKVKAGQSKVLSNSSRADVPLPPESQPKRSTDYQGSWVEGVEWLYGGVGFCTPSACICCNCRFDLDYFNRSFVPEPQIFSVDVLDAGGNLITRIGRCGNVDDGVPVRNADRGLRNEASGTGVATGGPGNPQSEIRNPKSIGGDEVALFHANYVATDTDRRLFIADQGNARIVSVKLGYYAEEKVALKDVADTGKK